MTLIYFESKNNWIIDLQGLEKGHLNSINRTTADVQSILEHPNNWLICTTGHLLLLEINSYTFLWFWGNVRLCHLTFHLIPMTSCFRPFILDFVYKSWEQILLSCTETMEYIICQITSLCLLYQHISSRASGMRWGEIWWKLKDYSPITTCAICL